MDGVFAIADGMGGRGGGALAARTAIDRLLHAVADHGPPGGTDWPAVMEIVSADVVAAGLHHGIERLGCTLLVAASSGPLVTVVHVGDSRAYRLTGRAADDERPARLDLLTRDHNIRAELLAAGLDVGEYRERGVAPHGLTSYIGLERDALRVDVVDVAVRAGDRLLLCTDGVHRQVDDTTLRDALGGATCQDAAAHLVALADESGGRDNATALVLEISIATDPA